MFDFCNIILNFYSLFGNYFLSWRFFVDNKLIRSNFLAHWTILVLGTNPPILRVSFRFQPKSSITRTNNLLGIFKLDWFIISDTLVSFFSDRWIYFHIFIKILIFNIWINQNNVGFIRQEPIRQETPSVPAHQSAEPSLEHWRPTGLVGHHSARSVFVYC